MGNGPNLCLGASSTKSASKMREVEVPDSVASVRQGRESLRVTTRNRAEMRTRIRADVRILSGRLYCFDMGVHLHVNAGNGAMRSVLQFDRQSHCSI